MKKLKKIYVEITNICNMNCSFCPKTKRNSKFMSVDEFSLVLEKIRPYTDFIYLHVLGEPLLHPNIGEILDVCEDYGIQANMTTNGTLIKEKGSVILNKKALRQINYSLHSFPANTVNFTNEEYLKDIFEFIDNTDKEGRIINCLRLWNMESSLFAENKETYSMLKKHFNLDDIKIMRTDRNGIKLRDRVFLQQDKVFFWPNINCEEKFSEGKCFGLKSHMGILADGTVIPCCLDSNGDINLGNIFEMDFSDILNSERVMAMRKGFSENRRIEKLCKTCGWNFNM